MARRWSEVLGTEAPVHESELCGINLHDGFLSFVSAPSDVIAGFGIAIPNPHEALNEARKQGLPVHGNSVTICGTQFELSA
jgi:hypothetical protein